MPLNAAFQTDDLNDFDSDCDEAPRAQAILLAHLSSYASDVISEVPNSEKYQTNVVSDVYDQTQSYYEQSTFYPSFDIEITSDSNFISYEQYLKETESAGVETNTSSYQQNAMIMLVFDVISDQVAKCTSDNLKHKELDASLTVELESYKEHNAKFVAFQKEFDTLKFTLSKHEKEIASLITKIDALKKQSKETEAKYIDEAIDLEKQKKELENIVYKVDKAFWLRLSNPISKQPVVQTAPIKTEAPCELPKVCLVKTSFQKLKNHLANFDKVVKVRTTPDAITKGAWGFEHTKEVFMKEVIPFLTSFKELFNGFDKGLNHEITEVKTVFEQMEAAVEQCSVDKKYFEIEKKELVLEHECLLKHIICLDVKNVVLHANANCLDNDNRALECLQMDNDHLMELLISQDLVHTHVNTFAAINDYKSMEQSYLDEYNETLALKGELAKKNGMVEKSVYNELLNQCSRLENWCISLEIKMQQSKETQLKSKNVSIENLKKHIANLNEKNFVECAETMNKSNVVTSKVYKLDLQPLPPRIKNNRETHIDYLKVTQEHTGTLRDIVEQARALKPLDNSLNYACKTRKVKFAESCDTSKDKTQKQIKPQEKQATNVTPPNCVAAEAVNTTCYTQNRSLIRLHYNKNQYELMHDKKPDLSYLHVFGSLCYLTNDSEDLGKLKAKADIGIFIGYTPTKKAFRIYNKRARLIMETIHVTFDELITMASEQFSSGPALQSMTHGTLSSRLVPNPNPQTPYVPPTKNDWDLMFQLMFDE
ncbi:retrovirus-related pol polyprotein from transposon TNT 1-94 [Tanacetum coccineum]